jgi:hypothetical protein
LGVSLVTMPALQIIIASTRPGRAGPSVAAWIFERAVSRGGFDVELARWVAALAPLRQPAAQPAS